MKVRVANQQCIQAISFIWKKVGIPIRAERHSIAKLEKLFAHWHGLQKNKTRQTAGHKAKEDEFVKRLDDLFCPCRSSEDHQNSKTTKHSLSLKGRKDDRGQCWQ